MPRHAGRRPPFSRLDQAPPALVPAAEAILRQRLAARGIRLEAAPGDAYTATLPDGRRLILKLLARAAPHRRGGGNNLGLHWLLHSDVEDYVALVDLWRSEAWLMPVAVFRERARPLPGGRFHLDWLVLRLSPRSRLADEADFEAYRFDVAIPRLLAES